jgi:hypothetical protein
MKTGSDRPGVYLLTSGLLLLVLMAACSVVPSQEPQTVWEGGQARVSLEYSGRVRGVSVVGDFNDWNHNSDPFVKMGGESWRCELDLAPGEYLYLLAIEKDESWSLQLDPANPLRQKIATGRELSLLEVRPRTPGR